MPTFSRTRLKSVLYQLFTDLRVGVGRLPTSSVSIKNTLDVDSLIERRTLIFL